MKRIEIRGIIVPADYDVEWFQDYIDRGLITPESRIRKALAIGDDPDVEIYLNSPGGSVFAGNEIINSLMDWKKAAEGRKVTVTVGAMAASMASAIMISASDKVRVHRNAKIMFHGAWGMTVGGAEAHKDEAALLDKINADMKTMLVSRYALKPEQVDEWFKEGREEWLNATDAKSIGMAHEIIGEDAPVAAKVKLEDIDALATKGMRIAACAAFEIEPPPQGAVAPLAPPPNPSNNKPEAGSAGPLDGVAAPAVLLPTTPQGTSAADGLVHSQDAGGSIPPPATITDAALALHAKLDELQTRLTKSEEETASAKATADKATAEARAQQSAKDKAVAEATRMVETARKEIADLKIDFETRMGQKQKQNDELATRLNRLTVAALTPSPEVNSWSEAMQACAGNYSKARSQFPGLFMQMIQKAKAKK